jgi:serine/threonine-protein kinase
LLSVGERDAARRALLPLDREGPWPLQVAVEANRALAELDEADGALTAAAERWERLLADDIDDPQAHTHLRLLRPGEIAPLGGGASATLIAPEGLETLRYRLVRELGRGASAAVYLARDEMLGIPIALKVLHPQLAGPTRSEARRRFFAEARLAAALRHPGVIAVYDVDEKTRTLSMEYIPGGTLRARLRGAWPIDPAEALATARSFLAALAYVHQRSIVHGDLKPSNLLLRTPGVVVLADFGIAQLAGVDQRDGPAGTPLYLAPEQFRGAPSSPGTDLFAAGAILWELVTGRSFRDPTDLLNNLERPTRRERHNLESLGPTADRLALLIEALTDPDPQRRPSAIVARQRLGDDAL